ncbi:MAG: RidA family protein [Clostridia bacterium]|nr:RidA family protein [Clostridia bacterium]
MKEIINTNKAPAAIGPYSQAVKVGNVVYTSGAIPADAVTGQIVGSGITEQTEQVLKNLTEVLKAAGASLNNVVKTTVFIKNMNDFAAMNEVYGRFFTGKYPARSTVEVARLPKDVLVEIECIAII